VIARAEEVLSVLEKGEQGGGALLAHLADDLPGGTARLVGGRRLYRRINEVNFRGAVLILLIVSGVSLLAKTLM
jgi:hypothetical protein